MSTTRCRPEGATPTVRLRASLRVLCSLATPVLVFACSGSGGSLPTDNQDPENDAAEIDAASRIDADTPDVPFDATGCTVGTFVGLENDFPVGTWKQPSLLTHVFVARDSGGFWAYSDICTLRNSEQLTIASKSGVSTCPYDGSSFDGNGTVLRGPAVVPLRNFAVTLCGGGVFVDATKLVAKGTRTAM